MGSLLQVRGYPTKRAALKARAAARGQSLNAYLLGLIDREVAKPTVGEVLERAGRRAEHAAVSAVGILDEARSQRDGQRQRSSSR